MAEQIEGFDFYSYNLTVETKLNIDELIYINTPMDLPLLTGLGADGIPVLPRSPVDNVIFYWQEEDVLLPRATLAEALDASETGVDVSTGEGVKFRPGDGIRIDGEVMIVSAVTGDTLTVVRGSAAETNTTAATHNSGAEVIGIGSVLIEGEIAGANFQGRDKFYNYTQIWSASVEVSRTEQRIPKYGVPNELNKQIMNVQQSFNVGIEQAALYGVRHQHATTYRRQTGGLDYYIATNVDASSPWLTVDSIEVQQAACWELGGMFDYIQARPKSFQALNNTTGSERIQTVTINDGKRGRVRATSVITEFGEVHLGRNRWVRKTDAFCGSRENFIFRQFQPMVLEKLAKTKDKDSYMMVAEGGFEVKGQDHMAKFTALDPTSAVPGAGLV